MFKFNLDKISKNAIYVAVAGAIGLYAISNIHVMKEGNVGVRTVIGGEILNEPVRQGFYQTFISNVTKCNVRQTTVKLENLKPKAADKLLLTELDATVYYTINENSVPTIFKKYKSSSAFDTNNLCYPMHNLIANLATSATNDGVAKYNSMDIVQKREELENTIMSTLQRNLDEEDKGVIKINRVVITNILTDMAVEQSIRNNIIMNNNKITAAKQNEITLQTAKNDLEVAELRAKQLKLLNSALTPELLEDKRLDALAKGLANDKAEKIFVIATDPKNVNMHLK